MKHSEKEPLNYLSGYFGDGQSVPGISEFQQMILSYFEQHGRDMAWRHTSDPYQILVSEVMLQQTQVERVARKFPEFIERFPTVESLATASLSEVLTTWQGMGYNRRAVFLQKCAVKIMTEYNGVLPADVDQLAAFPGIGKATASSIAAFAFNMPVVFIETNIRRVFIHFFFDGTAKVSDADILPIVKKTLYIENPRVWYWALMDLGSSLKKAVVNPNRRSAHYSRQTPFEGSDRKIRGKILKILLEDHVVKEEEFCIRLSEDHCRVSRILRDLESEGFIRHNKNEYIFKN